LAEIDFDKIGEYIAEGDNFKSWNDDSNFKFNALYFDFSSPYKIEIEFWGSEKSTVGIIDLLFWPNAYFEIKPTQFRINHESGSPKPENFSFYANPYFRNRGTGRFEPRVYATGNISKVIVKKTLEFKEDDWCKYAIFLIRRAKDMYDMAKEKEKGQVYGLCLHFSRFCIELSLKSLFPVFQMNVPHKHDVSKEISKNLRYKIRHDAPNFEGDLTRLIWISQLHIRSDRLDFYGDPLSLAPSDLFVTPEEGKTALNDAEICYQKCCQLFEEIMQKK